MIWQTLRRLLYIHVFHVVVLEPGRASMSLIVLMWKCYLWWHNRSQQFKKLNSKEWDTKWLEVHTVASAVLTTVSSCPLLWAAPIRGSCVSISPYPLHPPSLQLATLSVVFLFPLYLAAPSPTSSVQYYWFVCGCLVWHKFYAGWHNPHNLSRLGTSTGGSTAWAYPVAGLYSPLKIINKEHTSQET